jgi:hypothetical protein
MERIHHKDVELMLEIKEVLYKLFTDFYASYQSVMVR